ncbi:DinB family protein [Catenulispora sp. NL8]|uniref:DinB family protein n=1 Tax=Catenulispora pinistramenti TaxID=2705254 RepID=A0ABS5KSL8_9ACTN|nr:DinB family protein [Catenulispora pinistramenti]MBS2549019.1 DinB family protein [Catenulispora pinistramenti]
MTDETAGEMAGETAGEMAGETADPERASLGAFLDLQREGLIRKLEALSDHDARRAPTASSLSLLGLVKHSALWERRWFQVIFAGRRFPGEWPEPGLPPTDVEDFRVDERDAIQQWVAYYREQIEASREICATFPLGQKCDHPEVAERDLRYVMTHMIEETARHAGHADIIRETIDGATGMGG